MELSAKLGVDTGSISFVDADYILRNDGELDLDLLLAIMIPPGKYRIVANCDCWLGKITKDFTVNVPSGKLIVGDICYCFHDSGDNWTELLEKTDFFRKTEEDHYHVSTGGDGEFDVQFMFSKIND